MDHPVVLTHEAHNTPHDAIVVADAHFVVLDI